MKYMYTVLLVMIAFLIGGLEVNAADMAIHNGSKVSFDYTLTVDGKVVDSSKDRGPLNYTQGDGTLIPGLMRQLESMKTGEEKTIEVAPEEGYGAVNPQAFRNVPLTDLPAGMKPEVGMMLQAKDKNGRAFPVRISQVNKDSVIMDLNHPLAGKKLSFKVKIVSVQ